MRTVVRGAVGLLALGFCAVGGASAFAAAAGDPTTTTVTLSATGLHPYQPVTITAMVAGSGETIPAGTVDVTRGAETLCAAAPLDPSTRTATCAVARLDVGVTRVKATYVPAGAQWRPSSGSAPARVTPWTPTVTSAVKLRTATCPDGQLLAATYAAPASASAAVSAGLPAPSGMIDGTASGTAFHARLDQHGVARVCIAFGSATTLSFTYAGDPNYASLASSVAAKMPNTAPRGGSAPGSAGGGLADTGPASSVAPTLVLGGGLVFVGLVLVLGARDLRTSQRRS